MLWGASARGFCPFAAGVFMCACACGMQPAAIKSGQTTDAPATALPIRERGFLFDGEAILSPGLEFRLRRASPSVDSAGMAVGIDEARFGPATTIASDVVVEQVRSANTSTTILCSGVDRDGHTPLLVVRDASLRVVDVFTGANNVLATAELTGVGRARTNLGVVAQTDLLGGAIPERRYDPKAGAVCHGLIVLVCSVSVYEPFTIGAWPTLAIALVASQDRGQTWQLIFEDTPVQEGSQRLREWSLQNWSPVQEAERPTEAWMVATDYRSKPLCDGGIVYGVRAVRPNEDAAWEIDSVGRIYETPRVAPGQHAHAAAAFPGPDGLRAIVGIGDTIEFNRIVRLSALEPSGAQAPWSSEERFHGSEGTPGNQFVGCATIGATGQVLVGSDLADEQILGFDGNAETPAHRRLYGGTWSDGLASQVFMIRSPTPERHGPYCATYDPQTNNTLFPPHARRLLYSDDGVRWAQMLAPVATTSWTAAVHGNHVYIDGEAASGTKLRRSSIPALRTVRPLHIGPGLMQRLAASPTVTTGGGGTFAALSRNAAGLWEDSGVVLHPQPPSTGRVWKAAGFAGTTDTRIADILLMQSPTFGQTLGTKRMVLRVWTMNALSDRSCTARFELRPSGGSIQYSRMLNQVCVNEWRALTLAGDLTVPAGQRPMLRVRSGSSIGVEQSFYLALDAFAEGLGYCGYPGGPDVSVDGTGTPWDDEHGAIAGLDLRDEWTVSIAGCVPDDGVDEAVRSKSGVVWPLFSLWCSPDERLYFVADAARRLLEARLVRNATHVATYTLGSMVWTRGSTALISIARPGAGQALEITVAACGMPAREMTLTMGSASVATLNRPVREIRFDDGSGIDGIGVEVRCTPMLWLGGTAIENRSLTQEERRASLRTLDFLPEDG